MFIAFAQGNGTVQAIALLVIEAAALITASVIRPWMDKHANALGISICAINFVNSVFLLIMTDIFEGPGLLIGIVSVLFFILNAAFALILLIIVLIVVIRSLLRKNPEMRYLGMGDNRSSFIKSSSALAPSNELDELAYTARGGEGKGSYMDNLSLENDGFSDHSLRKPETAQSQTSYQEPLNSPINPNVPFMPLSRTDSPNYNDEELARPVSPASHTGSRHSNAAAAYRSQNNNR